MRNLLSAFCVATVLLMITPTFTMAAKPIPVSDLEPFQWAVTNVEFDPTQLGASASFTVPAGKLLVIEYVSGNVFLDIGDAVVFSVSTTVNGVLAGHQLLLTPVGPAGGFAKSYTASKSLRLYADSQTEVTVYAGRTLQGNATMHATISGYLTASN